MLLREYSLEEGEDLPKEDVGLPMPPPAIPLRSRSPGIPYLDYICSQLCRAIDLDNSKFFSDLYFVKNYGIKPFTGDTKIASHLAAILEEYSEKDLQLPIILYHIGAAKLLTTNNLTFNCHISSQGVYAHLMRKMDEFKKIEDLLYPMALKAIDTLTIEEAIYVSLKEFFTPGIHILASTIRRGIGNMIRSFPKVKIFTEIPEQIITEQTLKEACAYLEKKYIAAFNNIERYHLTKVVVKDLLKFYNLTTVTELKTIESKLLAAQLLESINYYSFDLITGSYLSDFIHSLHCIILKNFALEGMIRFSSLVFKNYDTLNINFRSNSLVNLLRRLMQESVSLLEMTEEYKLDEEATPFTAPSTAPSSAIGIDLSYEALFLTDSDVDGYIAPDSVYMEPIFALVRFSNNYAAIEHLLSLGAEINYVSKYLSLTSLEVALSSNKLAMAEFLISKGAKPSRVIVNSQGDMIDKTILTAFYSTNVEMLKLLLANGSVLNRASLDTARSQVFKGIIDITNPVLVAKYPDLARSVADLFTFAEGILATPPLATTHMPVTPELIVRSRTDTISSVTTVLLTSPHIGAAETPSFAP